MRLIKPNTVYFPLISNYFQCDEANLYSWKDVFTHCKVNRTKNTLVDTRFFSSSHRTIHSEFFTDLEVHRQIVIGSGDKMLDFTRVQNTYTPTNFSHEPEKYQYIKDMGIDFEGYFDLYGQKQHEKDAPYNYFEYRIIHNRYDIVVLK